jgi:hypothetical protein
MQLIWDASTPTKWTPKSLSRKCFCCRRCRLCCMAHQHSSGCMQVRMLTVVVCCNCCRMITSGVAGLLCLAAFCFLQTFISVYRGRLVSAAELQRRYSSVSAMQERAPSYQNTQTGWLRTTSSCSSIC